MLLKAPLSYTWVVKCDKRANAVSFESVHSSEMLFYERLDLFSFEFTGDSHMLCETSHTTFRTKSKNE